MKRKLVLIVDDDEDSLAVFEAMLSHSGYRVVVARNGAAGVALARELEPALILMDLWMPEMDGWAATRAIRSEASNGVVILALTAHAQDDARVHAADAGFDGFLTKPIQPAQVVEEVRRRIGEPG